MSYENNIDISTTAKPAIVTIKGINNFYGQTVATFQIVPKSMSGVHVMPIEDQHYAGWVANCPIPTVVDDEGKQLSLYRDFTVTYDNNWGIKDDTAQHPGLASAKVTGCGIYSGEVIVNFKIIPATVEDITIEKIDDIRAKTVQCKDLISEHQRLKGTEKVGCVHQHMTTWDMSGT